MTKKQFWQSASNWGFLGGIALFVVNLAGWALKFETENNWLYELLLFVVICPLVIFTGKRNVAAAGPEGYPYGRAVGYVFAMMMFAGIVYGVGRFLIMNFIAREYYDTINADAMDAALKLYQNTPLYERALGMQDQMIRTLSNPFYLILTSVLGMVARGGFLGLVLCAFFKKNPDIFAPSSSGSDTPADE